ncbi:hypothetical protein Bra3105_13820 [Brachybacterium halotolerans subsp. kimchii]|uniref:hypothetical protein n=1 Tax=Brachybacterium halotolerans TaxID=2795215 RepID=UPI001E4C0D51|nr:hypothetical protein [Brachybacterium halotolerans]UEJ81916.1 hypothetical protein Bra3105_13820 [Brachybacterium halotolerans subsp. kimchii]
MSGQHIIGAALVLVGGVLALFLPDLEFLWFRGRPLGVVLVVLGVIDLLSAGRPRSGPTEVPGPRE